MWIPCSLQTAANPSRLGLLLEKVAVYPPKFEARLVGSAITLTGQQRHTRTVISSPTGGPGHNDYVPGAE